nr:hypothetical protein [Pedobacter suwonensis]
MLDHLIVALYKYYSFAEHGVMPFIEIRPLSFLTTALFFN